MTAGNGSPRQRYRDQVRAEIKQAALAQMSPGGPAALSLNAVAKELGVPRSTSTSAVATTC
jgi:AcrR family transcriptional regulator